MAKRFLSPSSGSSGRVALLWILLAAASPLSMGETRAQVFRFSLEDLSELYTETPWDTLGPGQTDYLTLGPYHRVPNFLKTDFSAERVIEEFDPSGDLKITFRVPRIELFGFTERKDGVFIVLEPRDLSTPNLRVEIEPLPAVAEKIRRDSFKKAWQTSVLASISRQPVEAQDRRGLLNVSIPLPLPGAVERIIGRGEKTNIDISGRESITFAGESRRVSPFIGVEGQQSQPLFPSLDMKQELDVRLRGTIGEKVNVQVDHSSSSLAENQNRIRLNYQGFEDDIVKLIELGNTSLSLPGSQLVSFSTSSQGLFGIKALAQVGPLDVTMIASKQEGEVSRATFSPRGGTIGQTEMRRVRDIDYVVNTYFFLDRPPDSTVGNVFFSPREGAVEVFESVFDSERTTLVSFIGKAWVDRFGTGSDIRAALAAIKNNQKPPPYEERFFKLLDLGDDYRFLLDAADESIIGIELTRPVDKTRVLAVRYVNANGDTVGNFGSFSDTLALELIKPFNARPDGNFGYTWPYMIRNIYNLGLSNIDPATLEVEIEENSNRLDPSTPEGSPVPWLRVFGLDRTDESGVGPPDSRIDLTSGLIDLQRGILTFPVLTPFNPPDDSVAVWTDSVFAFTGKFAGMRIPQIYTDFLTVPEDFHRYTLIVRAASTTKTFSINAFNIQEGSEVVRLDGRQLQRNRDYTINYDTGEVELKGDVLNDLTPASNITIDYEFKPFGGGAASSLVGFSSTLNVSENSKFGSTWLYESRTTAATRPRLGEEPSRAIVGDIYGNVQYNPGFLTSLVNLLPRVDTDAPSSLTLGGAIAMSVPDPNTRGEVYIDDMEGVEDSDVFQLTRRSWYQASPPVDLSTLSTVLDPAKRERFFWYNIEPDLGVHRRDLNPLLDEQESSLVPSIDIELDTMTTDTTRWAGIMTGFRAGGLDLSRGQFIEIWVNDFKPDPMNRRGLLRVELGNIDEDFYEPAKNEWNNEDKNRDGFNALTEDTGLDGIFNGTPGDDPNDDYGPQRIGGRFTRINGTEGNFLPDTEDLDGSGQMETSNYYFSFSVNLADSAVVDVRRDFPTYSGFNDPVHAKDSWRLYRIDLSRFIEIKKDGVPNLEQIRHLRIWFDHIPEIVNPQFKRVQLAGFKVVGNRWEKDGLRDLSEQIITGADTLGATFAIGVISNKTEPVAYNPPIRPNKQNDVVEKEQSLLLKYENLPPRTALRIRKRFGGTGLDFTNYRDLNFFTHTDILNDSLEYYVKIAFDSLNYYEVAFPLDRRFINPTGWIGAMIQISDITGLKFDQPDSLGMVRGFAADIVDPSRLYSVTMLGNPSLFNVRFLFAGLRNKSSQQAFSGELWINDIYLGDRKRDIDFAQRVSANLNMGNIVNINASWQRTGPDFRGLRQSRGSGTDNRGLSLSARTRLDHFIPLLGFNVPVTGNYSRASALPKFTPNSDTEITDRALQDSLKTESVSRGFSTTLTRKGSTNPLLKYSFDKLTTNFSMSETRRISPSSADTTLSMGGTADYSIAWGRNRDVRLSRDFRIRYWLNTLNVRLNANRRTGRRYRNVGGKLVADPAIFGANLDGSGSATYVPFPSLSTSFRMQTARDIRLTNHFLGIDIGTEVNRSHTFQANYRPPPVWFIGAFSPDLNVVSSYSEDSSPNVRRTGDPEGVRNVANNRDASLKLRFDLGGYFEKIFKKFDLLEEGQKRPRPAVQPPGTVPPGGTPPVAPGVEDTLETGRPEIQEPDTARAGEKPDVLVAVRKLGGVLSRIRKINTSIQHRVRSTYSRIPERPDLLYQLAVRNESGVSVGGVRYDDPERIDESLSLTMDSGVELTKNIDVSARYSTGGGKSIFRSNETETRTTSWPDLNLSWKGLENWGPFRPYIASSSAIVGYRKTSRETSRGDIVLTTNETMQMSPSLVLQWKNGLNTTVGLLYNKNTLDTQGSVFETTNSGISFDMKYSFVPGKGIKIPLPFLAGRKLRSRLDSSTNIAYSRNRGKRFTRGSGFFDPVPGTSSLRVSPRLTYNFSSALNGSFFVEYSRSYSEATNQTTTTVRVGINAVFTF